MKAFLLTPNPALAIEHVHRILNSTSAVNTWVSPFPGCIIVISSLTLNELAAVLQTHFAGIWFLLAEVNKDNANGWLPPQFWDYISNPYKAWSEKVFARLMSQSSNPPSPPAPPSGGLGSLLIPKK